MAESPSLEIHPDLVRRILVDFLRTEITRAGFSRAVVGLSGGLDSALSCFLAAEALGPENVLAVRMPYQTSSPDSLTHAALVISQTGVRELDRMKSDFLAIARHELRTPLGLILGHATFLKEVVPPDYAEQMDVIIKGSMRLKAIVEDMSTISHKEEGQSRVRRELFSMTKLVIDTVSRFKEPPPRRRSSWAMTCPRPIR